MTAKTRANFKTSKNADFADAPAGNITALELRTQFEDLADSALFPEDAAFTTVQTNATAGAGAAAVVSGKTLVKHNLAATVAPAVTDNATPGYGLGSIWAKTNETPHKYWMLRRFSGSDAVWDRLYLATEIDAALELKLDVADLPQTSPFDPLDYYTKTETPVRVQDCAGNPAAPRDNVSPNIWIRWTGNNGIKPTNVQPYDTWDGMPEGQYARRVITGATDTLILADQGGAVWANRTSGDVTVTIPTNASVGFSTDAYVDIIAAGPGVVTITGAGGVTLNGVVAGSVAITLRGGRVRVTKFDTNTWVADVVSAAAGISDPTLVTFTGATNALTTSHYNSFINADRATAIEVTLDATALSDWPTGRAIQLTQLGAGTASFRVNNGTLNGLSGGLVSISGGAFKQLWFRKVGATAFQAWGEIGTVTASLSTVQYSSTLFDLIDLTTHWLLKSKAAGTQASGIVIGGTSLLMADGNLTAGGGSAGWTRPGGGGGGQVIQFAAVSLAVGTHSVTIGAQGAQPASANNNGNVGADSVFGSLYTAKGGGYGGGIDVSNNARAGGDGGNGGGTSGRTAGPNPVAGGLSLGGGFAGGANDGGAPGGGGGAAQAGGVGVSGTSTGGFGGDGISDSITGSAVVYGAGGPGTGFSAQGATPSGWGGPGSGGKGGSSGAGPAGTRGCLEVTFLKSLVNGTPSGI